MNIQREDANKYQSLFNYLHKNYKLKLSIDQMNELILEIDTTKKNLTQNTNNTSRDYKRLFDKICNDQIIPCFVDYDWKDGTKPFRDIAKVRRKNKGDIDIGARGICYGNVTNYDLKNNSELNAFVKECERLNLEYYT